MVGALGIGIIFGLLFSDITARNECTNCKCCNHNSCFWGGTCTWGCKDGYWGNKCYKECHNNMCVQCDRNTGLICSKCVEGYYGSNCEHSCQPGHYVYYNKECRGCGFSGCTCNSHLDCDGCLEGYYANQKYPFCLECPTNCKQCTAWCMAYEDGYYPNENGECINCSVRCLDGHCDSVSGKCKEGCSQGFWGKLCNQKCNASCNKCNRFNGECLECASNRKYGPNCDMNCTGTCVDKECYVSGKCTNGCLEDNFGEMCEHECDHNCIKSGHGTRCSAKSGKCLHGCTSGYTAAVCLKDPEETSSGSRVGAIGGTVGGSVILSIAIIAVIAFIALRKRYGNKETSTFKTDQNDEEHVDSSYVYATVNKNRAAQPDVIYATTSDGSTQKVVVSNLYCKNTPEKKARTKMIEIEDNLEIDDEDAIARENVIRFEEDGGVYYNNANEVNKTKVKVEEFPAYVTEKTNCSYEEEFKKFPYGLTKSYEDSQKAINMSRNRYKGIYPYDDSRVKVWYNGSDYINASFIDGYKRRNEYIATLGPMSKQLGDFGLFWEVVWQQKVEKVVMVTNLIEEEKEKCEQYWPDVGSSARYGNVNVTCLSEDEYAEFTRRTFQIYQSQF
ncbi:PTPRF-like protein [Mya arenaria]|uniref:protein-tyrosine-phosphatase n=1 Tax=Mya arenaria TaxID=6604 RepID=A0ABY7F8E6_MYAAR|nr:PTPRF-like protein [Mya arenaria]